MKLTESQIALLQNKGPFEVMLWLDENETSSLQGMVCCAIRAPRKTPFKDFAITFDNLEVTNDNDKQAELRFHVTYLSHKAFKRHFKYVFNLEEPSQRYILKLLE